MKDEPREPRWDAPIDVEAHLAAIPEGVTTKGLFLTNLADRIEAAGAPRPGRWTPFRNYPVREYAALLVRCAEVVHPGLPLGRGLREVGFTAYPAFAATTLGKVVFSFAGTDPKAALRLAPRAYDLVSAGTSQVTLEETPGEDRLYMRGIYSFPQLHEAGVIEGGIRTFGGDVDVLVSGVAPGEAVLHVRWR